MPWFLLGMEEAETKLGKAPVSFTMTQMFLSFYTWLMGNLVTGYFAEKK